jgi:peptide/nickel transport system permease protein
MRRVLVAVLLVLGIVSLLFFVVHLLPGDPLSQLVGDAADPAALDTLRRQLGLDRPLVVQYGRWIAAFATGDLGTSLVWRRPVAELLREALPNTLLLALLALGLRFAVGIAAGTAAALRHRRAADRSIVIAAVVVTAIPGFWLAVVLQLVFAYGLGWLPSDSMRSLDHAELSAAGRAADLGRHLVLPVLVLGLGGVATTARHMRASLLETLSQEWVQAARARGLGERAVVLRHALRTALVPIATLAGLSLPALVGGSLVVETVFSWPGMGRLAMQAVAARDYPVMLAATALSAMLVVAGNVFADLACGALDPRTRMPRV